MALMSQIARWPNREQLCWVFVVLAMFQYSTAALAQQTIFNYGTVPQVVSLSNVRTNYTLQVANVPNAKIGQIQNNDILCLGDFHAIGSVPNDSALLLNLPITDQQQGATAAGRCLYRTPVQLMQKCASQVPVTSFATNFQFTLSTSDYEANVKSGKNGTLQGLAFIIVSDNTTLGDGGGYLGWLNSTINGSHNFAVEIDFFQDVQFDDPIEVHVGIDLNSLTSVTKKVVGDWGNWSVPGPSNPGVALTVNVWIDYDGFSQVLEVYINGDTRYEFNKPSSPLISTAIDLSDLLAQDGMFVGFSGSVSNVTFPSGYDLSYDPNGVGFSVYDWTFNSNGPAPDVLRDPDGTLVDPDAAERASERRRKEHSRKVIVSIAVPSAVVLLFLVFIIYVLYRRNSRLRALAKKYQLEELEHLDQGPQNFKYKVLSRATKGFSSSQLLGSGGFGSVYRGKLGPRGTSKHTDIAVKQISASSHQGAREFLAEIKVIGQVQHRNLVRLLGWCHEKGELLLVYDYMPNGSLDQHLFKKEGHAAAEDPVLTWSRRLKIVSGVAVALAYLHEEWEKRVIHRDVKSSNVMLDGDFNARLGDFGLAKLFDHGQAPPSTAVLAGTHGYMAPELAHTFKATEKTDVFSFGALVLEVATGRRPLLPLEDRRTPDDVLLVDWVWSLYRDGNLLEAADRRLGSAYDPGEMVTLLKIGLLCSHPDPNERPSMRGILNIWKGSGQFPSLPKIKPVPIFAQNAMSLAMDSDFESMTTVLRPMEEGFGHSAPFASRDLELPEGLSNDDSLTPELRFRPWKSTPLPM